MDLGVFCQPCICFWHQGTENIENKILLSISNAVVNTISNADKSVCIIGNLFKSVQLKKSFKVNSISTTNVSANG